jgi:hypothetical protein
MDCDGILSALPLLSPTCLAHEAARSTLLIFADPSPDSNIAKYTLWLAGATIVLAMVTVWSSVRSDVSRQRDADLNRLSRSEATRKLAVGVIRALRTRLHFYSEEVRAGRAPLADATVLAPLIAALLSNEVAEAFNDHFETVVEAAVSTQEAALALERLREQIQVAGASVARESQEERILYEWAKKKGGYAQTQPYDYDRIRADFLLQSPMERLGDEKHQLEIAMNDAIRKGNDLDREPWFNSPAPALQKIPWWHSLLLLGRRAV